MWLRGVLPLNEDLSAELENLQQILPPTSVATANLRWLSKELGELYECTCVKEGCTYQPDSFLGLSHHLKRGHYSLKQLRRMSKNSSRNIYTILSYHYPVNTEISMSRDVQLLKSHQCRECDAYFVLSKAIEKHYSM